MKHTIFMPRKRFNRSASTFDSHYSLRSLGKFIQQRDKLIKLMSKKLKLYRIQTNYIHTALDEYR